MQTGAELTSAASSCTVLADQAGHEGGPVTRIYCSLLNFSVLSPNRMQSGRNPIGQQHLSGQMDGWESVVIAFCSDPDRQN